MVDCREIETGKESKLNARNKRNNKNEKCLWWLFSRLYILKKESDINMSVKTFKSKEKTDREKGGYTQELWGNYRSCKTPIIEMPDGKKGKEQKKCLK